MIDTGWHLSKNITVGNMLAIFMAFVALIGSYYTLDKRLSLLEQYNAEQEKHVIEQSDSVKSGFERVDRRLIRIEDILLDMAKDRS